MLSYFLNFKQVKGTISVRNIEIIKFENNWNIYIGNILNSLNSKRFSLDHKNKGIFSMLILLTDLWSLKHFLKSSGKIYIYIGIGVNVQ